MPELTEPLQPHWRARLSGPKKILHLYSSIRLLYCEFLIPGTPETPPLRGIYIGEGVSLPYYLKLYRADVCQTREIRPWRVPGAIAGARAAVPIVLVEINRILDFLLPVAGLRADSWVQQETDLDSAAYRRRRRGIERGWGQKVRKQGYRSTQTQNERDLVRFYNEFYLPHVIYRHGEITSTRSLDALRKALREGFLLQVWQNDLWVSGVVASLEKTRRVSLLAVGLSPPHRERMQGGALSAAYYFLFQWAEESGVRTVNFCGSRPNEMDGVFQHKKLWAAVPKHDPWHHTEVVFFLDHSAPLPEAIQKQLISHGAGFVRIDEYLSNHQESLA